MRLFTKMLISIVNVFFSGTHFFRIKCCLLNLSGFEIGENTKVVGPIYVSSNLKLHIGGNCWIGKKFTIHGNGEVYIGDNCDFAPEVCFLTGSHEIGDEARRAGQGVSYSITIENGCWIGARATIMGNTTIGDSSVVAACALVNKDVERNCMVGGVPAKILNRFADDN